MKKNRSLSKELQPTDGYEKAERLMEGMRKLTAGLIRHLKNKK